MLRAGLIGFPATGKSTLFRLLTSAREAPRPPTGKADANVGVTRVPDARLDRLSETYKPRKTTPATIEFSELAGTTRAAAGAKELLDVAAFRSADALLHVVRAFRDDANPHQSGSIDPQRDVRAMEDELILADLGVVERRLERLEKDVKKSASQDLAREQALLTTCRAALEHGAPLRTIELGPDDSKRLRGFQFLSAKPLLLVVNVDEADLGVLDGAVAAAGLAPYISQPTTHAIPLCAKIELEIAELGAEDAAAFMSDLGLEESGLDRVIRASYELLGYISFFTVGEDECRAWSIARGTLAPAAAAEIHTDIARGFIRAEVVSYEQLMARGSYAACRDKGEVRLEGKDYVVRDGDVINFRFAT
jgi:ribosome-binding ATPase